MGRELAHWIRSFVGAVEQLLAVRPELTVQEVMASMRAYADELEAGEPSPEGPGEGSEAVP